MVPDIFEAKRSFFEFDADIAVHLLNGDVCAGSNDRMNTYLCLGVLPLSKPAPQGCITALSLEWDDVR